MIREFVIKRLLSSVLLSKYPADEYPRGRNAIFHPTIKSARRDTAQSIAGVAHLDKANPTLRGIHKLNNYFSKGILGKPASREKIKS